MLEMREAASVELNQLINDVLPQLDMPEKTVQIKVTSLSGRNSSLKTKARGDGCDIVEMLSIPKGDKSEIGYVELQFSSGETARLALAIESSILNMTMALIDPTKDLQEGDCLSDGECLLVCDEIDAHIGGEASNAAARILRQIGKFKQVLA